MEITRGRKRQYTPNIQPDYRSQLILREKQAFGKFGKTIFFFSIFAFEAFFVILITYLSKEQKEGQILKQGIINFQNSWLYKVMFISIVFTKSMLLLIHFLQKIIKNSPIFQKIVESFYSFYPYYRELEIVIIKIFLLSNIYQSIALFIISILQEIRDIFFSTNYVNRKHSNYVKCEKLFIEKVILQQIFTILCVTYYYTQQSRLFMIGFSIILGQEISWLIRSQFGLNRQDYLNRYFCATVALHISIWLFIAQNTLFAERKMGMNLIFMYVMVTFIWLIYCQLNRKIARRNSLTDLNERRDSKVLKQLSLSLFTLIEENHCSSEEELAILGRIKMHMLEQCQHQACFSNNREYYDSANKSYFQPAQIYCNKFALINCYTQCLYQKYISEEADPQKKKDLTFDYCEFIINSSTKMNKLMILIQNLELNTLSFVQRQKIIIFKRYIEASANKINCFLYDGKLNFDQVKFCEQTVASIEQNISQYLSQYYRLWEECQINKISLQYISVRISENKKLIEVIDNQWQQIEKYTSLNYDWKKLQLSYFYLVKNGNAKDNKVQMMRKLAEQSIVIFHLSIKKAAEISFSKFLLSDAQTCYFRVVRQGEQLLIDWISNKFTEKTKYSLQKVYKSPLQSILPADLQKKHRLAFNQWFDNGHLTNENSYQSKDSMIILQDKSYLQVIKAFKTIYNIHDGLRFLCLLRFKYENQVEKTIKVVELQSQQKVSKNKLNWENSIFVKQSGFKLASEHSSAVAFRNLGRLLVALSAFFILLPMKYLQGQYQSLIDNRSQATNFLILYRFPMALYTNYMKFLTNNGSPSKLNTSITTLTNTVMSMSSNKLTIKTLYNPLFNAPTTYHGSNFAPQFENTTYSQIDMFYSLVSSITSVSKLPIDYRSPEYRRFVSLINPAYNLLANNTKNNLHNEFQSVIQDSKTAFKYVAIISCIFTLAITVLMLANLKILLSRQKEIYRIITQYKSEHYLKVIQYIDQVRQYFNSLSAKPDTTDGSELQTGSTQTYTPKTYVKHHYKSKKGGIILFIFTFCLINAIILGASFLFQYTNYIKLGELEDSDNQGFSFFRYFPCISILAMGITEKYYSLISPQQMKFNSSAYEDTISAVFLSGNYPYQNSKSDSDYSRKKIQYYFNNPCRYNYSVVAASMTIENCQSICNGSFSRGLSAFYRYNSKVSARLIRGETNITLTQLNELLSCSNVLTLYMMDTIDTWIREYTIKNTQQTNYNKTVGVLIICLIAVIHLITNEIFLSAYFRKKNEMKSYIYDYYMPSLVLQDDKMTKQKLIMEGIIQIDS